MFYADLHIHSKFSRATSRDCDLEHLAQAAAQKGIGVVGTGDFTHPGWWEQLQAKLLPAEPGLYRLRPELEKKAFHHLPVAQPTPVRFLLQVEIATIYKKAGQTRKVHHLIYVPQLEQARQFTKQLARLGNVASDGRPILGLDSRTLLELVLQSGPGCFLVPAHVWTPWFSVFGAHSGFDRLEDCYEDLSSEIFALETGLSSDPPMNWRWSALDRFALMSNSDAHSPAKLGRECCVFDCPLDYFAIRQALQTGQGYAGTVEFFPEEGKYHLDGHRQCGICWQPEQTQQHAGRCPQCGRPVTLGVLHRVCLLADRPAPPEPLHPRAAPFRSLIPLCEILGEILQVGPETKSVQAKYEELLARLGPELWILEHAPLDQIARYGGELLGEAIRRMRCGQVIRQAGFDGQYGIIRLFTEDELRTTRSSQGLFAGVEKSPSFYPCSAEGKENSAGRVGIRFVPDPSAGRVSTRAASPAEQRGDWNTPCAGITEQGAIPSTQPSASGVPLLLPPSSEWVLAGLDPQQRAAAECLQGPVLILAGPGTGKTRTLTHRIAYLVGQSGAAPESCLAITFSRRAAAEMRSRLERLLPHLAERIPVMTFHAFGWQLVREYLGRLSAWPENASSNMVADSSLSPHPTLSRQGRGETGEMARQGRGEMDSGFPLPPGVRERFRLSRGAVSVASVPQRRELLARALELSSIQADRILKKISLIKRTGTSLSEDPKLEEAFRVYEAEMGRRGWLDFDDLVRLPVELLRADPAWRAECQRGFRFVSVDEFQDIDWAQYELLRTLVPPEGNICAIGDPDQSIYGFRGANPELFEQFLADYPTAQQFVLTKNYRSSQVIVEAAGQMIGQASLVPDRRLEAQPGRVPYVEIHTCPTERAEAELVVQRIEQLLGGPTFFSLDSRRSHGKLQAELSFSDIAVLYRTEAQAVPLVEALARSGMPFQVCSHRPLAEIPFVQKFLQELLQPACPPENLPERVRQLLESVSAGHLGTGAAQPEKADQPPEQAISPAILVALQRLADKYGNDLAGFLAELAMITEADLWDSRAERISLLTLHAAKGLEFAVVFIVGCEDGLIPLRFSGAEQESRLAEERRLLFVGMTRAKEHLILSHAQRRLWQGKVRTMEPSPFLADIQRQLLAFQAHRRPARRRPSTEQPQLFQ